MGFVTKAVVVAAAVAVISLLASSAMDGKARMYVPSPRFLLKDMPRLDGKVCMVTGANTGLGLATATELARAGATVYVAARSPAKQEETKAKIVKAVGQASAKLVKTLPVGLDLGSFKSIRAYVEAFQATGEALNVLVNNAGIMMTPYGKTEDGIEQQFGVNHVGHFLLTISLMPELERGQPSRVVSVSSAGHNFAPKTDVFGKLDDPDAYSPVTAYGISKLANILFTSELQRRVGDKKIFCNSVHPGFVQTELGRHIEDALKGYLPETVVRRVADGFAGSMALNSTEGALTQLFLAASPRVEAEGIKGRYYVPTARDAVSDGFVLSPGYSPASQDAELAATLWALSVKLTGVDLK